MTFRGSFQPKLFYHSMKRENMPNDICNPLFCKPVFLHLLFSPKAIGFGQIALGQEQADSDQPGEMPCPLFQ